MNQANAQSTAAASSRQLDANDHAGRHLGIEIVHITPGECHARMTVARQHLNGFDVCHGGLIFSLADTAFAHACNSGGIVAMGASATIHFLKSAHEGDILSARATELASHGRSGVYQVLVMTEDGSTVAQLTGRSHMLDAPVVPVSD